MATVAKRKKGRRRGKDGDCEEAMENLLQEVNRWMGDWVERHEGVLWAFIDKVVDVQQCSSFNYHMQVRFTTTSNITLGTTRR